MFVKTLRWPVISLLITGGVHFLAEAILPDLKNTFIPPVLTPILLAYGIWVGYKMVQSGGNYGQAVVAGAILGILPVILDVGGFGIILGRGVPQGVLAGVFGFAMILFGSLIGGGFALSKGN
jgi:hypothetical protein